MIKDLYKELEDRRAFVEKCDFEIQNQNNEHFRSFWLNINIMSSAIVIGLLPVMVSENTIIKSLILAKSGLLIVIAICVIVTVYFQNVSKRTKRLLSDQIDCHRKGFLRQRQILNQAEKENKTDSEIFNAYNKSKNDFSAEETNIIYKHIFESRFSKSKRFLDKYFNSIISYMFALGILLIILSFVI